MSTHLPRSRTRVAGWLWNVPLLLVLALVVTWVCVGCQSNPVSITKTPLQQAYAVYGEFVIVEEQAAALKKSGTEPPAVLTAITYADTFTKPAADALLNATLEVSAALRAVQTGQGTPDALATAQTKLTTQLAFTQHQVTAFSAIVQGK
jgi:hypothetical protein